MRKFEIISEEQWNKDVRDSIKYYYATKEYSDIKLPKRATSKSAGYDIYSPVKTSISKGFSALIPTGLKVDMDDDDVMLIIIRSSLGIKKGISITNQTGVIDADYYNNPDNEGHIWLALSNNSYEDFKIDVGDRIAQAIFIKYSKVEDDEPISYSRDGGIGSTK